MKFFIRFSVLLAPILMLVACNRKALTSLYMIDIEGGKPTLLISNPMQSYWGPAWSPDGTKFVVMIGNKRGDLYLLNADGSNAIQLTHNQRSNYMPTWSRDGKIISFISQTGNTSTAEIFTIHIDGTNEKRLTTNDAWEYGTSWSVDDKKIIFGSDRNHQWQIYTMNSDGSNQVPLPTPAQGNDPAWSPDGSKIVFTSNRDGNDDIWIMNSDGSEQQNLTHNHAWDDQPQWSPDGTKIAFTSDRDGTADIFVMNNDGSNAINLTKGFAKSVGFPTWSADGSKLIFHAASPSK